MLSKLKALIKQKGIAQVTADLGYRSDTTIRKWITAKKIPNIAEQKVKEYLCLKG